MGRLAATEAGAACLRYGFLQSKATSLGSIVDAANIASIKVASRVHVAKREYQGKNGPMLLFGTTADQFAARHGSSVERTAAAADPAIPSRSPRP